MRPVAAIDNSAELHARSLARTVKNEAITMTRLANISARSKTSRLHTLLFSACLGLATVVAASGVATIAAAQL